ncbi:MAG TPA: hypothetical protein VNU95_07350 [Candidatus Acidoferrales bacterium]|jgi:hypothetical protein|nr:hypothetical protein [Candidatus Acidoferrales bacterium]
MDAELNVQPNDLPKPFKVTPELESWLLEAADKPVTPLTQADFEGIRKRAQKFENSHSRKLA